MLIVIEGLDGAGKSTQVKKLKQYLEENCDSLSYVHFPRYETGLYGQLISSFLRGDFGQVDQVHPQLVALLFAEDRHAAAAELEQALSEGRTVLLDRYVYSNIGYQCAKLSDPVQSDSLRQWITDTEYGCFGLPRPDLNIFLDVPISFIESSLASQRSDCDRNYLQGRSDIHEADIELQKRVREVYRRQTEIDPKFISIDCSDSDGNMLPPDDIFAKIRVEVDRCLKK